LSLRFLPVSIAIVLLSVSASAGAESFARLHEFGSSASDGFTPYGPVIQGTDGNFYGVTFYGGLNDAGVIFRMTAHGAVTTLYSFCLKGSPPCPDGGTPVVLIQGTDGDFYGTTLGGGALQDSGTVFKVTPSGTLTTLHRFCSKGTSTECPDGAQPNGLIQGTDGNFYGTTFTGGRARRGTFFRITPKGVLTTLYSFCAKSSCDDGSTPLSGVIEGTDGKFYGTTESGGARHGGTVFKITSSGTLTTLSSFCAKPNCTDGAGPNGLIQGSDGNLYGTTEEGGYRAGNCQIGCGTIFRITLSGKLTTLYSFCRVADADGGCPDGNGLAGLIQGTDGDFYGTTSEGGSGSCFFDEVFLGCGTLFKITSSGKLTTLYNFCSRNVLCPEGNEPNALTQGTDGSFYGIAVGGGIGYGAGECFNIGPQGCGTAFRLSVGLGPFVETQPVAGKPGQSARILGSDLKGATRVTFNGAAAKFAIVSQTEITTTVPADATTGYVEVVTPRGTLKSNEKFLVR
jgi:uncharacterized repeat protein (TIGR03803 family)